MKKVIECLAHNVRMRGDVQESMHTAICKLLIAGFLSVIPCCWLEHTPINPSFARTLFLPVCSKALLMCHIILGRILPCTYGVGLRKPPDGYESVGNSTYVHGSGNTIFAVFDNDQAYPAYIVHII